MKIRNTLILTLAALPLAAAEPDYFPLQVGNQWIYRQFGRVGGEPVVVDIPRTEIVNQQTYYVVRGLEFHELYLRMDVNGTLYAYDTETRQEGVWAAFATAEGESYRTIVNPCNSTAHVVSRSARVTVPIGEFNTALAINYPAANCADAGLSTDFFLPYVGLVERELITIAGPRALRLSYARLGGVTVLSEPAVSFSLALDKSQYSGPDIPMLTARLTIGSTQPEPLVLTFPSRQRFDFTMKTEAGDGVFPWSASRSFAQVVGTETISGERNWVVTTPLSMGDQRLPAGRYIAEAWLTTMGPRTYVASVGFEIR
jgi:hypothetical protein